MVQWHWRPICVPIMLGASVSIHEKSILKELDSEPPLKTGISWSAPLIASSPSSIASPSSPINVEEKKPQNNKTLELQKRWGQKKSRGHHEVILLRSLLSMSCKLKLAKGGNEVIMGPLLICQLHVSRPDHHHNINAGFFCSFRLCNDKCSHVKKESTLFFALNRILLSRRDNKQKWPIGVSEDGCQTDSKPQHKTTTLNISVFHKASLCRSLPSSHRSIHPGSLYVILLADKHQTKRRILSLLTYLPRVTSVRNVISSGWQPILSAILS